MVLICILNLLQVMVSQSIGIAKYFWHELTKDTKIRKQKSVYYGFERKYTKEQVSNIFKDYTVYDSDEEGVGSSIVQ